MRGIEMFVSGAVIERWTWWDKTGFFQDPTGYYG
jgi:hypothetical protein